LHLLGEISDEQAIEPLIKALDAKGSGSAWLANTAAAG